MINITDRERADCPTAVSIGFFDGLHLGHIEVIRASLNIDGLKSTVFTFNEKTLLPKFQKYENIITYEQKLSLFDKIGIDYLFAPDFEDVRHLSAEDFSEKILKNRLNAKKVSVGFDFTFGEGGTATAEDLKRCCKPLGIEVSIIPAVTVMEKPVSSSLIRGYIKNGEIDLANWFLGYELSYDLEVVDGAELGRTIGAPTINQIIPERNVIPKYGVYKSWTSFDGKTYPSVTNIGVKPTVTDEGRVIMETNIIGFEGDLYGRVVNVSLRDFLRPEMKFGSIEELKSQIERDRQEALC